MKRVKLLTLLLSAVVFLGLTSCEKDENNKTTYEIVNNSEYYESSMDYLDGTLWEVIVYQYIGDDIAKQSNLDAIAYGGSSSGKIEVENNVEKIKVSYKLLPKKSEHYELSSNYRMYIASYKFIEEGKNNILEIDGETMVGGSLKSANINQIDIKSEYTLRTGYRNINILNQ